MAGSTFDVAVVGAGMLGAATAYRLARAGRRVIVLDAAEAAAGATGNSFAWLNAVSKEPEAYHRLNAAGMKEYDTLEVEMGGPLAHRGGCLEWAVGDPAQDRLEAKVARLQARGYAVRWIDAGGLRALEPGLRVNRVERAAFYERDAWVDAPPAAALLLDRVRAAGGEVRTGCRVARVRAAGGRVSGLDAAGGAVKAGAVVLCAGTGTEMLARGLGASLPVERRPGLLAVTTPVPPGALNRIVYAPGFHMRPDAGGGLRIGADDVDALTREDTPAGAPPAWANVLLERAAALLPALADARIERLHVGVRPVPADGLTIAGRLPGWENAYVAVTHSGITLGPLLGRLLTEEITTGQRDPLLAPFRPERFAAAR